MNYWFFETRSIFVDEISVAKMNLYKIRCRASGCTGPDDPFADQLPSPVASLNEHTSADELGSDRDSVVDDDDDDFMWVFEELFYCNQKN